MRERESRIACASHFPPTVSVSTRREVTVTVCPGVTDTFDPFTVPTMAIVTFCPRRLRTSLSVNAAPGDVEPFASGTDFVIGDWPVSVTFRFPETLNGLLTENSSVAAPARRVIEESTLDRL